MLLLQAFSRLAGLLAEVRHHDTAARMLETLLAATPSHRPEHLETRRRLTEAQTAARGSPKPDHYQVLGVPRTAATNDVRSLSSPS
jgi:hypothetical protein